MNTLFEYFKRHSLGAGTPLLVMACVFANCTVRATQDQYIITGYVGEPPQVDARDFINYGTVDFTLFSLDPFTTSSTLNYSNFVSYPGSGQMTCSPGWKFDYEPAGSGTPRMAANFFNDNLGSIEAANSILDYGFLPASVVGPSWLFVSATNIINHGRLVIGANGWMELRGHNVDLSYGSLLTPSVPSQARGSTRGDVFFDPDVAVYDLYWGTTNIDFNSGSLWNGSFASSPGVGVIFAGGGGGTRAIGGTVTPPDADSDVDGDRMVITVTNLVDDTTAVVTNVILYTNVIKEALFVMGGPTDMTSRFGFKPSPFGTNRFKSGQVVLSVPLTNRVDANLEVANIYVQDDLPVLPERGFLENSVMPDGFRPTNYVVSRIAPQTLGGAGSEGFPEPRFFVDSGSGSLPSNGGQIGVDTVTNTIVSGEYAAYSAFFDRYSLQATEYSEWNGDQPSWKGADLR